MRLLTTLFFCLLAATAAGANALPNGEFDRDLEGWNLRPGDPAMATVTEGGADRGKVLLLHPQGKNLGVESDRLEFGKALKADTAYEVRARLKNEGLGSGVFAFSIYCYDAAGKALKQIVFSPLNPRDKPHDWQVRRGQFGPGTTNPLPEGTASIAVRFSFFEKSGDCRAKVLVDAVTVTETLPSADASWPREIIADVGDLQVRFESRSFWTLYRVDYQGTRLGVDNFGSHYGTVANFPGVGFIGSGHTENEDEQVLSLALTVDGKPVDRPQAAYRCREITLRKQSRVRDLHYTTTITVADNRILEEVVMVAKQPTKVSMIYHFMHPWTRTATHFLAETEDGKRIEGAFNGDDKQKVDAPTRWSAIYDAPSGKGAVTRVLAAPEGRAWRTRYWDVAARYRKHYFATFLNETVPADQEFRYRVVVVPFAASPEAWQAEAERLAAAAR